MGKTKINRSEMFRLMEEHPGKWTTAELAKRYDCSATAVWKARNKGPLTPEEVLYVDAKWRHPEATNKQIGELAFPEFEHPAAKVDQLSRHPMVLDALKDKFAAVGLTQEYKADKLKAHCDSEDDATSLKALDMSLKVTGDYAPKEAVILHADISPVNLDRFKTR